MSDFSVIFTRISLLGALQAARAIIPSRIVKPVLAMAHLATGDGTVTVHTTNLEASLRVTLTQVQVESQGALCVSCEDLLAVVRESGGETIRLHVENDVANVATDAGTFKLYTANPSEFPPFPSDEGTDAATISTCELSRLLQQTMFAASEESTRYTQAGVLFEFRQNEAVAVATEGHVIALSTANAKCKPRAGAIVPIDTARTVAKLIADEEAGTEVAVALADNRVTFSVNGSELTSTLIDGRFPPYNDVIPKDCDKKVFVNRDFISSIVRQAALLGDEATERGKKLACTFSKSGLSIAARETTRGEASVSLKCKYEGADITIGLNSRFLLEGLRAADSEDIAIEFAAPNRPALLTSGARFKYVQMPINLT